MANINDYLQWRGDISLEERLFNDADNVILSVLSYLDFTGIVPGERTGAGIGLALACRRLLERAGGDVVPYVRSLAKIDSTFVELMADSRRFGSATLRSYVDVVDEARSLQFSAFQVDLPSGETYVAFRGTDSTLVGWREDFMLSFEVTEAQREAAAYLERALVRAAEQGRMVRVGGHSKGGNLAEYAAVCCPSELRERIVRVYSNDGPGMAPEVMRRDGREVLGDRLRRIVPTYSVVGMLFARADDPRVIVPSTGVGIGQHDPTTWQVLRTGVEEALQLLPECVPVNEAVARWAEGIPLDERERVTDEVFDALEAGGATRFDEIGASAEGLQQVLHALANTDDRTRELAMALVGGTLDTSVDAARKAATEFFDQWKRGMRSAVEDAARKLVKPDAKVNPARLPSGEAS